MSVYKVMDRETGKVKSWYCIFRYHDYTGKLTQKIKRGFLTRAAALEYERAFLERLTASPDMTLQALCDIYLVDMSARLKPTTMRNKRDIVGRYILPVFKDTPINEISPAAVRQWQQNIMVMGLSPTYQHAINRELSAMLNYAVRFHHLTTNPARVAGAIGKAESHRAEYWTPEQFSAFLLTRLKPIYCCLFPLLFWTGCRVGEALALTADDVDIAGGSIRINKTYTRIHGQEILQTPKTPASNRVVTLPGFMVDILKDWIQYTEVKGRQRLFEGLAVQAVDKVFRRHAIKAGVPVIHVHDLRHSHASLLVSIGCSPVVVKERLGHQSITTTINTYSHLFPTKQGEIANRLQNLSL